MVFPRIKRTAVTTPPSGVSDGGYGEISSAFGAIARAAYNIGQQAKAREQSAGTAEGTAAFLEATRDAPANAPVNVPERKGGFFDFAGVEDEAYANAVQLLTITRAKDAGRKRFAEMRGGTTAAPAEFERQANDYIRSYVGAAPVDARAAIEIELRSLASRELESVIGERRATDISEAKSSMDAQLEAVESDIDALLRNGGPAAAQTPEYQALIADRAALQTTKTGNPLFAYSGEERALDDDNFARRMETAVLLPQIAQVFGTEGRAAALSAADEIAGQLGRDTAEVVALRSSLRQEVNLLAETDAAAEAEADRALARNKRYIAQRSDEVQRELIDFLRTDAPQEEKLARIRADQEFLSPSEYDGYLKKVTEPGAAVTDAQYGQFLKMARAGQLSADDVIDLGLTEEQTGKLVTAADKYKSGVAQAGNTILGGAFAGGLNLDEREKAMEAEARAEFDAWLDENPKATATDARDQARQIAAARGRALAVTAHSRYLVGDKPEDFIAAEDALLDDASINDDERAKEARKLAAIRAMVGFE